MYIVSVFALVATSGCMTQSKIQSKYIAQQENCRSEAEQTVSQAPASPADNGNSRLVMLFSECMNKAGWHVAVPKPSTPLPPGQTAQNPPTGIFPSHPPAVSSARAPSAQPPATPAASGAEPVAAPVIGPGVIPNPPPATASPQMMQPPAQYQPTQPLYAPYGSGAGRNF